jgi:plastocyanin
MKLLSRSLTGLGLVWKASAVVAIALALIVWLGQNDSGVSAANTTATVDRDWFVSSVCEVDLPTDGTTDLPAACEINITEGDTVTWGGSGNWNGNHTVTGCADLAAIQADGGCAGVGPIGDSGFLGDDSTWGPRTFNTAGTYYYKCNAHAQVMLGKVVVAAAPVDSVGPTTSSVVAGPSPTNGAASVTLTANVDDSATGNSNIQAAEYYIDVDPGEGSGTAMAASDASFDSATENVTASVNVSALADGTYDLFVRGQDAGGTGNWGAPVSFTLTVSPPPAGSESATVEILGGDLSVTTKIIAFGTITLTGVDQTVDTTPAAWTARDARGNPAAGWNVSLTSTDFTAGLGSIAVANFKMQLQNANIVTLGGNTAPVSQALTYQPLSSVTPLKLLSAAAGTGMGMYDFTPDGRLTVPAESIPDNYEALMTVTINSGP